MARRRARWAVAGAAVAVEVAAAAAWVARAQPPGLARLLGRQRAVLVAVPTTRRAIAVTLDDGPHEDLTPQVLEVLERHGARATFFLLGSGVERLPSLTRAVVEQGHEVGNHGWLDRPTVLMSGGAFRRDLRRTATVVLAATGREPRFVRPGSGWFRPVHLRAIRDAGCELALGSVAVLDLRVRDVEREVAFLVDRLQPGAVVVLHEGRAERAGVVPLLDRLLIAAREHGYEAVTLSELRGGVGTGAGQPWPASSSRS
jgi:peptidoglycan/xylan/chitin deacetylase (PgdA/CDA1 family)